MKRYSTAVWRGNGKEGSGFITTESSGLQAMPFSFNSRFDNASGTNPEELLAAAQAACFTMKLSFILTETGFPPQQLNTTCYAQLDMSGISQLHIVVKALIPGISEELFLAGVQEAEATCPLCRIVNTRINLEATLLH